MRRFRLNLFLYLLAALLLIPAADAYGRRKKNKLRYPGVGMLAEPDALPQKLPKEQKVAQLPVVKEGLHVGYVNSRFREGIDVSHYQGRIDWSRVAATESISYVYLKATEGATYVDDTYRRNLAEVRRVGLSVGSYHFYRPNVAPHVQFDNIRKNIKIEEQDLVPIIDIEVRGRVSAEKFIRDLKKLVHLVEKHYGKKPLLYSYQNFYNRHLCGEFPGYQWMIAKYQDERPVLNDGHNYIMWQYTAEGSIDGVGGPVDRSRIMGDFLLKEVAF